MTGYNTVWTQETASTLFSVSGLAGASISGIVVQNNYTATITLDSGSATGIATITDNITGKTATLTCYAIAPAFSCYPPLIPANNASTTVTLTGVNVNWVSGTTIFSVAGVAGVSIASQSVASATSATITLETAYAIGTLTITDGSYNASLSIVPPVTIDPAYVSRNGQTAYFLTAGSGNGVSPTTFSIVGTSVTSGGSGYTAPIAAIQGGIALTLTAGGSGYTSVPSVVLTGGNGAGASATAIMTNGSVSGFTVIPGSGYTSAPTVTIVGGGGLYATATASLVTNDGSGCALGTPVVSGGMITMIPVVNPGSGYTSTPVITITDPAGSGASATSILGGSPKAITGVNGNPTIKVNGNTVAVVAYVTQVAISDAGTGYATAPTVTVSGGSGSGLSMTSSLTASGQVALTLTAGGSGYLVPPTVIFAGGGGSGAAATAAISGGSVIGFFVTNVGSGYTSAPTVSFTGGGGSGATATASFVAGSVSSISVSNAGSGYLTTDNVTVTIAAPSSGITATAVAQLGPTWTSSSHDWAFAAHQMMCGGVQSILVQTGGSNYTSPTITVTGGGGTGLVLGTPVLVGGVINGVTIATAGTGRTKGLPMTIIDSTGAGSGFVGNVTTSGGSYTGVTIESGGQNYSSTPANLTVSIQDYTPGYAFNHPTVTSGVILSIPVVHPGTGYTSQPTVSITDSTGSGAVAVAMMSGPAPTDIVTYSAPSGWISTSAGSTSSISNAPMFNYSGVVEPWFSSVGQNLQLGSQIGAAPGTGEGYQTQQNWLKLNGEFRGSDCSGGHDHSRLW